MTVEMDLETCLDHLTPRSQVVSEVSDTIQKVATFTIEPTDLEASE